MRSCKQMLALSVAISLWSAAGVSAPPAGSQCQSLSERECLESTQCDLVQVAVHGAYECRASVNRCAIGFRQGGEGDIKQQCESQTGCKFVPASCFCPPDLTCACGGGPPPQCVDGSPPSQG